jgi:hypothetical protein
MDSDEGFTDANSICLWERGKVNNISEFGLSGLGTGKTLGGVGTGLL